MYNTDSTTSCLLCVCGMGCVEGDSQLTTVITTSRRGMALVEHAATQLTCQKLSGFIGRKSGKSAFSTLKS